MSHSDFIENSQEQLDWLISYIELKCSKSDSRELLFILAQLYNLRSQIAQEGDIK
jgi:hypothetical protein